MNDFDTPPSYLLALKRGAIELRIWPLVEAMNRGGFSTVASCEGHGLWRCKSPPFVVFRAHDLLVARLASLMAVAGPDARARLCFRWEARGWFREGSKMDWRLEVVGPIHGFWPSVRRRLDADIGVLTRLVDRVVEGRYDMAGDPGYMP